MKLESCSPLYIDQMLEDEQMKDVEAHLSVCDACRKEYEDQNEIHVLLSQVEMVPVPASFEFRLKKALKEEKQHMESVSAATDKNLKKKRKYRMITSIAAIFAVGILSFGVYQDILSILPDKLGGEDQAAMEQSKKSDEELFGSSSDNYVPDDTVVMKSSEADVNAGSGTDEINDQQNTRSEPSYNQNKEAASEQENIKANNDATMPDYGTTSPEFDLDTESVSIAAADGLNDAAGSGASDGQLPNYKMVAPREECSRSLTSSLSGAERNTAAVQYYNGLIETRLKGFDYQVLDSNYTKTGEWTFTIFIFRGKDGNTYNEEIMIIGKDGKIEVICSNEFMGL